MSDLTQLEDMKCGVPYAQALADLKSGKGTISPANYQLIKHKVKESLLKRKLISENIYRGFEYSVEGELIDVARYAEGNPECAIIPKESGKKFFYELYINATVAYYVSEQTISERLAQILATVELLESERIYIKLNVVISITNCHNVDKPHLLCVLPVFSHRDVKCINSLSSVINERFLRKFIFAAMESVYGDNINSGYGTVCNLPHTLNLSQPFNEVDTAQSIIDQLVTPCKKR